MPNLTKTQKTLLADLKADATEFSENLTQEDFLVPRLGLVQSMSPQRLKTKPEYIEGCEEGSIFNSVTQELYEPPVSVVPVLYSRRYVEWAPRSQGGGGMVNPNHDSSIMDQAVWNNPGYVLPNGNELVVTPEHIVLLLGEDGPTPILISMAASKERVSKRWNTLIRTLHIVVGGQKISNPPRFASVYELSPVPQTSDNGDFWNWDVKFSKPVFDLENGAEIYSEAKALATALRSGERKLAPPTEEAPF